MLKTIQAIQKELQKGISTEKLKEQQNKIETAFRRPSIRLKFLRLKGTELFNDATPSNPNGTPTDKLRNMVVDLLSYLS